MFLMAFENDFDVAKAWADAREQSGMKQDALAALMGITHSQLADQLAGRGHLSVQRLLRVSSDEDGRRFIRLFVSNLAEQLGFDIDALLNITAFERLADRFISKREASAMKQREGVR